MKKFPVKIITSVSKLFEGEADSVILPTASGQITVLADHANLISLLEVGELVVKSESQKPMVWLISGGTARFAVGTLTVLAEEGVAKEELVRKDIEDALNLAKEQKVSTVDPAELIQLEKRLRYETFKREKFE